MKTGKHQHSTVLWWRIKLRTAVCKMFFTLCYIIKFSFESGFRYWYRSKLQKQMFCKANSPLYKTFDKTLQHCNSANRTSWINYDEMMRDSLTSWLRTFFLSCSMSHGMCQYERQSRAWKQWVEGPMTPGGWLVNDTKAYFNNYWFYEWIISLTN